MIAKLHIATKKLEHPTNHWDALFKEKGGHDWLNRYKDFDYDESEGEHP